MKDLEYYLAYPLRWLASWAGVEYNGEFRNGHAAHVGWGLALTLIATMIWWPLTTLVIAYPIYREWNDAKGWKWNRKNWADLLTWEVGCLIGFLI